MESRNYQGKNEVVLRDHGNPLKLLMKQIKFLCDEEHLGGVIQIKLTPFDRLAVKIHFAAWLYCPTINVA